MPTPVRERIHRILRHLEAFQAPGAFDEALTDLPTKVGDGEPLLGVYRNPYGCEIPSIGFSETGIYLAGETSSGMLSNASFVKFAQMLRATSANVGDPRDADEIVVDLLGGASLRLLIAGGASDRRDSWELLRFFQRVLNDRSA